MLLFLKLRKQYPEYIRGPSRKYFQWRFYLSLYQITRCIWGLAATPFSVANQVLAFWVFCAFNLIVQATIWESANACTRVIPSVLIAEAPQHLRPFVRHLHSKRKVRLYLFCISIVTIVVSSMLAVEAVNHQTSSEWISIIESIHVVACFFGGVFLYCSYTTIRCVLQTYLTAQWRVKGTSNKASRTASKKILQSTSLSPTGVLAGTSLLGTTDNLEEKTMINRPQALLTNLSMDHGDDLTQETASINRDIHQSRQRIQTAESDLLRLRLEFAFEQMRNNMAMNLLSLGINTFYVICSHNTNIDSRYRVPILVFVSFSFFSFYVSLY